MQLQNVSSKTNYRKQVLFRKHIVKSNCGVRRSYQFTIYEIKFTLTSLWCALISRLTETGHVVSGHAPASIAKTLHVQGVYTVETFWVHSALPVHPQCTPSKGRRRSSVIFPTECSSRAEVVRDTNFPQGNASSGVLESQIKSLALNSKLHRCVVVDPRLTRRPHMLCCDLLS